MCFECTELLGLYDLHHVLRSKFDDALQTGCLHVLEMPICHVCSYTVGCCSCSWFGVDLSIVCSVCDTVLLPNWIRMIKCCQQFHRPV